MGRPMGAPDATLAGMGGATDGGRTATTTALVLTALAVLLVGLPTLGVVLAGHPLEPYLAFCNVERGHPGRDV